MIRARARALGLARGVPKSGRRVLTPRGWVYLADRHAQERSSRTAHDREVETVLRELLGTGMQVV